MSDFHSQRLVIVGVGLIGGSLARALRAAGVVDTIIGVGRDRDHLQRAQALGVIDAAETDVARAVAGADAVVVAVPVGAMEAVFTALAPALADDAVLTDAGSTKASVIAAAERAFGGLPANFVPAHPVAGTERSGVEASFAELFRDRRTILTPTPASAPAAIDRVRALWACAGARISELDPADHDRVLAACSHLPHVLAFALVDMLAGMPDADAIFDYAAGGFADFTRIASSSPRMWTDIAQANRDALLPMLEHYMNALGELRDAIAADDARALQACFTRAKAARDGFVGA